MYWLAMCNSCACGSNNWNTSIHCEKVEEKEEEEVVKIFF